MDPLLSSTLIKAVIPAAAIVVVLFASRRRGLSWQDDLGIKQPRPAYFFGWLAFWIAWIAVSEVAIRYFQLEQAKPWPEYSVLVLILRIAAIGVLGPIAEELVMRGVVLGRLRRTRLGDWGAILIVAVVWACFHYRYGWETLVLVSLDGVLFGLARLRGRSLWIPIAMHVLGNCISIWQSVSGVTS
jgi:membrane protease YdiL (CAAX protease family)